MHEVGQHIRNYIGQLPKAELHVHLEGSINEELLKIMTNNHINHLYYTMGSFEKFNYCVKILCKNFKNNMQTLLEYIYEDRFQQHIFYTQFQYSALKIWSHTELKIKDQFDIIIPIIHRLRKIKKYQYIYIDFILDIPRGNTYWKGQYTYFENNGYVNDIIKLIKSEKNKFINIINDAILPLCDYKYYIRGLGIGGHDEANTISKKYKASFDEINKNNIPIVPHAGEFGKKDVVCDNIKDALRYSNRLGHGVRILECLDITNYNGYVLDICITSNLNFVATYPDFLDYADRNKIEYNFKTLDTHPIKKLIEKNITVTLSTDDPGILKQHRFGDQKADINLNYEYIILASLYPPDEQKDIITKIVLNGIKNIPIYFDSKKTNIIPYLAKIQTLKIKEVHELSKTI